MVFENIASIVVFSCGLIWTGNVFLRLIHPAGGWVLPLRVVASGRQDTEMKMAAGTGSSWLLAHPCQDLVPFASLLLCLLVPGFCHQVPQTGWL